MCLVLTICGFCLNLQYAKGMKVNAEKTPFNYQSYFEDVLKLREEVFKMMTEKGNGVYRFERSDNVCPNQFPGPYPFYGPIKENGAIGIEVANGIPMRILTPLGYMSLTGSTFKSYGYFDTSIFENELIKTFGAKCIVPLIWYDKPKYSNKGAIYSITKLPWRGEVLPSIEKIEVGEINSYHEAKEIYDVVMRNIARGEHTPVYRNKSLP